MDFSNDILIIDETVEIEDFKDVDEYDSIYQRKSGKG